MFYAPETHSDVIGDQLEAVFYAPETHGYVIGDQLEAVFYAPETHSDVLGDQLEAVLVIECGQLERAAIEDLERVDVHLARPTRLAHRHARVERDTTLIEYVKVLNARHLQTTHACF